MQHPTRDPFGIDLPRGWKVSRGDDRLVYRSPTDDVAVAVAATIQGLRLHYRVECHGQAAAGLETTVYSDEAAAAARAEELIRQLS